MPVLCSGGVANPKGGKAGDTVDDRIQHMLDLMEHVGRTTGPGWQGNATAGEADPHGPAIGVLGRAASTLHARVCQEVGRSKCAILLPQCAALQQECLKACQIRYSMSQYGCCPDAADGSRPQSGRLLLVYAYASIGGCRMQNNAAYLFGNVLSDEPTEVKPWSYRLQ